MNSLLRNYIDYMKGAANTAEGYKRAALSPITGLRGIFNGEGYLPTIRDDFQAGTSQLKEGATDIWDSPKRALMGDDDNWEVSINHRRKPMSQRSNTPIDDTSNSDADSSVENKPRKQLTAKGFKNLTDRRSTASPEQRDQLDTEIRERMKSDPKFGQEFKNQLHDYRQGLSNLTPDGKPRIEAVLSIPKGKRWETYKDYLERRGGLQGLRTRTMSTIDPDNLPLAISELADAINKTEDEEEKERIREELNNLIDDFYKTDDFRKAMLDYMGKERDNHRKWRDKGVNEFVEEELDPRLGDMLRRQRATVYGDRTDVDVTFDPRANRSGGGGTIYTPQSVFDAQRARLNRELEERAAMGQGMGPTVNGGGGRLDEVRRRHERSMGRDMPEQQPRTLKQVRQKYERMERQREQEKELRERREREIAEERKQKNWERNFDLRKREFAFDLGKFVQQSSKEARKTIEDQLSTATGIWNVLGTQDANDATDFKTAASIIAKYDGENIPPEGTEEFAQYRAAAAKYQMLKNRARDRMFALWRDENPAEQVGAK